jgi:protocatechuate 3,4-dioxygenase beta subunit
MSDDSFKGITRRRVLGMLGAASALSLFSCGGGDEDGNNTNTDAGATCTLVPELTKGPFFVGERLNRSDITDRQPSLPLPLNINVSNANTATCSILTGVQIDIWHANATGAYSDIAGGGTNNGGVSTEGQPFLRGYQVTDANGNVSFTTIYPGWCSGRAPHIHLKARIFNAAGNATLEATSQLFFDDSVYANNTPYNSRGARDMRNAQGSIYGGQTSLLLALTGSSTTSYMAEISMGIAA